jgi:hypothetical protein
MKNKSIFKWVVFAMAMVTASSCRQDSREINTSIPANDTVVIDAEKSKLGEHMADVLSKDGTKIAFEKSGSGAALIIVSGALSARSLLDGEPRLLIEKLSRNFTVYV